MIINNIIIALQSVKLTGSRERHLVALVGVSVLPSVQITLSLSLSLPGNPALLVNRSSIYTCIMGLFTEAASIYPHTVKPPSGTWLRYSSIGH